MPSGDRVMLVSAETGLGGRVPAAANLGSSGLFLLWLLTVRLARILYTRVQAAHFLSIERAWVCKHWDVLEMERQSASRNQVQGQSP